MMDKIYNCLVKLSTKGFPFILMYDPVTDKPSVTIFFAYVAFLIAATSCVALHFDRNLMGATIVSIMFWVLATAFYMLRKITKAKLDLKTGDVDLEDDDQKDSAK